MAVLLVSVATVAAFGTGFVLGILARLKTLRTFRNILIANLALVDFLTGVINMPMYLLWGVFKVKWFTGKTLAIFVAFAGSFSTFIGKTSMLVLLINAFLAITFDLKYYIWKTNDKAIAIVAAEWLIGLLTIVSLISLQLYDIDLGDAPLLEYNHVYIAKNLPFIATSMNLFIVSSIVFGFLMLWSVRKRIRLVTYFFFTFSMPKMHFFEVKCVLKISGAPNGNFRENICSEDDLRSRIFGAFVVTFLACLPLLRFSNIYKMV